MKIVYEDNEFAIIEDNIGMFIYYSNGLVQDI